MKRFIVILLFLLVIFTGILLYGRYVGTTGLKTNEIKLEVSNIPDTYNGLEVVHFSDIHYGRTIGKNELESIVEEINLINPDIVVFTGDLFDIDRPLSLDETKELATILKNINSSLGKYIIKGEHDNNEIWENVVTEAEFYNLNDKYTLIYNKAKEPIIISGISSNLNSSTNINEKTKTTTEYLASVETKPYSILLMHEPDYINGINLNNYDLILAGHSHNGQINIPLVKNLFLTEGSKQYYEKYYKLNETDLFISSGLGTSKINIRLLNKPSINFYRIIKK